ncbi:MAG: glycosyltransferase family 2 protein [Saprospiraceae bacterium]|nr:glycosyltransferase family 2 protein [Saprospiraceae bacterium]
MSISIIIPALNEEKTVGILLEYLRKNSPNENTQIIVVDGNSSDNTIQESKRLADIVLGCPYPSRAKQMNLGAKHAVHTTLYFVHCDVIPPHTFYQDIQNAVRENYTIGLYRQSFDSSNPLLLINTFCSRFRKLYCRGGDQTLFIDYKLFNHIGGFDENYVIMEEYVLLKKCWNTEKIKLFPDYTIVSARKYSTNSWLRVQWANFVAFSMFNKGIDSQEIKNKYLNILRPYNNY